MTRRLFDLRPSEPFVEIIFVLGRGIRNLFSFLFEQYILLFAIDQSRRTFKVVSQDESFIVVTEVLDDERQ